MQPTASNFTHLEIKNWDKYQKPNTTSWIKDYTNREDDPDFARLTFFQRGLLEGLCRLRARLGKPIPYDIDYISRALCAVAVERRLVGRSIAVTISRGFLIPCNQQDSFPDSAREEKTIYIYESESGPAPKPTPALTPSQNETLADKLQAKACEFHNTTANSKLRASILTALNDGRTSNDVWTCLKDTKIESNDRLIWKTLSDNLPFALIQIDERRKQEAQTQAMYAAALAAEQEKGRLVLEQAAAAERAENELIEDDLGFSELDSIPELDLAMVPELDTVGVQQ
jgi:hypothetical protein